MALDLAWYDWVGLLGTAMILLGFALLQAGRLSGTGLFYQLLNLFGALGILVSLLGTFNLWCSCWNWRGWRSAPTGSCGRSRRSRSLRTLESVARRLSRPHRLGTRREYVHVG